MFQMRLKQGDPCHLVSAIKRETSVFFIVYLVPNFLAFLCFCWWFCCLKWPPSLVLKFCVVLLSTRIKLCSGIIVLLAVRSVLMNQQYINIYEIRYFYMQTHIKEGYVMIRWWKRNQGLVGTCISPRNNDSVFANSEFMTVLWNIITVSNKNQLCFFSFFPSIKN